ncbi:MAG: efflux transporter periplasmic adaptor subunit [Sphingomonadales bacterium 32-68-7]|nr:MAG: efflux transporter periplasmic adaptor subunit [Sphingomonadales bacterium 12-68-11]OYX09737.1 MAG: efflux transporter periplasmic adaptor subunit [Sphingomonadales bacterium 32-68-7]
MITPRRAFVHVGLCMVLPVLAACSGDAAESDRPAPEVGFVVVQPAEVPITVSLGGRTVAFETSEVRPQINGLIRRRLFTEGSVVRAGQPLYQIDASLYTAAVNQAEANVASARASAEAAVARADRFRPLAELQAIAEQDYTDAAAQARVARAAVAQTSAALETARINLRYTTLSAPIGGRIGRSLSTVGALVSANQASPLAVIQRLDPIYVDMQQSSADLTALRGALRRGEVTQGSTSVRLELEDGSEYGLPGRVQFSDVAVDESTGTVTLRASFPNPDGLLLPGMFVKAVFEQAVEPRAFLVPQPALQRDFDGSAFVWVVSADNKAQRRKVTATRTSGTNWVVTAGLQPGDKVITQGLGTNVRPNAAVRPVPASAAQRIAPPGQGGAQRPGSGQAQ